MRISLAIISVLLVPAALASPFVPVQQPSKNAPSTFSGLVSHLKNAMKMTSLQRRQIEKDIDGFNLPEEASKSNSVSKSVSYAAYQQGSSYIYQQVEPEAMQTYVISDLPQQNFVYAIVPPSLSSSESAQVTPSSPVNDNDAITKVQISNGDIYFSQTDSFTVPDLSSFPADSPFIRDWPELPDEAPPNIGFPNESSQSV